MFAGITDWNICISKFLVRGRRGARPKAERFRPGRRPLKRGRLLAGACGACPGRAFGPARRPVRAAKSRPLFNGLRGGRLCQAPAGRAAPASIKKSILKNIIYGTEETV